MNYKHILAGLALASALIPAQAVVVGGAVTGGTSSTSGGTFVLLAPPLANPFGPANSVGNDTFQSPNLFAFNEDQNVFLTSLLSAEVVPPGGFVVTPGSIPKGTEVASHYVFFDPNATTTQKGWVDFDSEIVAILTSRDSLAASDYLANTGVNYLNPTLRGLEAGDHAWIDASNPNRLDLDWAASTPGDYVRVLTKHSPGAVPDAGSTVALLGGSIVALAAMRRRLA